MGECGCAMGCLAYKLKAPGGWYLIMLLPGCDYCSAAPSVRIAHPSAVEWMTDELAEAREFPVFGSGEHCISEIQCGLTPEDAKRAAISTFVGTELDGMVDDVLAEILGEDFWMNALRRPPVVVEDKAALTAEQVPEEILEIDEDGIVHEHGK